ncbi:uncharacterized protein TNCV_4691891 [Trichonephila clavipes]|nr:uncharacterized protein TNCV_4691891 [Trichonephila clavipes]
MNSIIERRVIHQVKISPKISAPKIAASTSNTLGRSVSAETFWNEVICSDENKFNIFGSDGRRMVWSKPNTSHHPKHTIPTVPYTPKPSPTHGEGPGIRVKNSETQPIERVINSQTGIGRKIGEIPELYNNRYSDNSRPQRESNRFGGQGFGDNRRFDSRRRSPTPQSDHRFNNQGGGQGGSRNGTFRGQNGQDRISSLRMTPVDLPYVPFLLNETWEWRNHLYPKRSTADIFHIDHVKRLKIE